MMEEYTARMGFFFCLFVSRKPFSKLKIKTSPEDEQATENCVAAKGNNRVEAEFHQGFSQSVVEDAQKEMI